MMRNLPTPFLLTQPIWLLLSLNSCSFSSKASKKLLTLAAREKYDLIIVPGVPYDGTGWSRTMKGRVYWSKYLYDQGITKNVMYSGSSVYTPYTESKIMALYAQAIGIPDAHIYVETKAEHSTENVYYSFKKARSLHFERIALASDAFQTRMLRRFTRKKVSPVIGLIPMVVDTIREMEPNMIDPKIDDQQAFEKNFIPLTQRQGFWKRLKGTLGRNLDRNAYP
jgi:uncharacterized SAM-binding protein YcdF (DUF218 family)